MFVSLADVGAGLRASDYIAKPVNTEELLALLRIWLFGKQKFARIQYDQRANGEHPHS